MTTPNIIAAVQTKWDAMTAGNFPSSTVPTLYFDEAPQVNGSGTQIFPETAGYAVVKSTSGISIAYAFGVYGKETERLEFEIYYPSFGDCMQAARAVQTEFDFSTLPALATPLVLLAIRPRTSSEAMAGIGKTGVPVHVAKLGYDFEFTRSG